jgi:hypothetical protein
MRQLDHTARTRPAAGAPIRQERIRLASDGVVAAYIHDISSRTATPVLSRSRSPRRRMPATRR